MEQETLEKKQEFENISNLIKKEFESFEKIKIQDFNQAIIQFLKNMIESQKEIVNEWQSFSNENESNLM